MTTDDFTDAARAVGVDPEEVRESVRNATEYASFNGMSDAEFLLWIWHAGAIYGREYLAAQEPTDAEVEAAAAVLFRRRTGNDWTEAREEIRGLWRNDARAVLTAAKKARA